MPNAKEPRRNPNTAATSGSDLAQTPSTSKRSPRPPVQGFALPCLGLGGVFFGEFDDQVIDDFDQFVFVGFGQKAVVAAVE